MKKKTKTATAKQADKTSESTRRTISSKPARKNIPSGQLESPTGALLRGKFDPVIARNGEVAYSLYYDSDNGRYAIGGVATKTRKELLGDKKRVPNDLSVCRALSQYLQAKGIRDVSSSTIYDWMRANETREELGGKDKAPKIPISFYVAVSRDDVPMQKRREYLEQAIKENLTVGGLKGRVTSGNGTSGDVENGDAGGTAIQDIASLERVLSESQSLLSGKHNEFLATNPGENSWTIARLESYAIYIWQLRDDIANGGAKKGDDE